MHTSLKCANYLRTNLLLYLSLRFCSFHSAYGAKCAVSHPECPNPHEPGRLTCVAHRAWEDTYFSYYGRGGYHARNRARAEGDENEVNHQHCTTSRAKHWVYAELLVSTYLLTGGGTDARRPQQVGFGRLASGAVVRSTCST